MPDAKQQAAADAATEAMQAPQKPPETVFGSMPGPLADLRAQAQARPFWEFTLPNDCMSMEWDRPESDLTFCLYEVKPREQAHAMRIGKDNAEAVGSEMIMQSLCRIGDWQTKGNRDEVTKWWDAIGPKGRALVQQAWMRTHQPDEREVASFLSTSKRHMG